METRKALIQEIKDLIDPKPTNIEIFRRIEYSDNIVLPKDDQLFTWKGQTLTRAQCHDIKCKAGVFVTRRIVKS